MTRKKVIFVAPYFKPYTGGLENYVANIEQGLRNQNWETVVVTTNDSGKPYQEEVIDGTRVYRLPVWFKISNTPVNPFWLFSLKKIFRKENPDIINAHAPVPFIADMAALAAGKFPFVLTYHAGTMLKGRFLLDLVIGTYENTLLQITALRARAIICPSQFVINTILKRFRDKSFVVSPGVDTSIFKPSDDVVSDTKSVLFISRFSNMYKMKGLFNLIEAMKQLPDITLKVVGESVSVNIKNIEFLGTKVIRETIEEIQKSSLLTLPSLAHAESFGMVLIEAMACKKPVIGTRIGGIPEVINDGIDGLLVNPGDIDALARAIRHLVDDKNFSQQLATNGYNKAMSEYNWEQKSIKTLQIFTDCVDKTNSVSEYVAK